LDEKKALGGAIHNYSEEKKITITQFVNGKGNAGFGPVLIVDNSNNNTMAAFAAAVHVLSGKEDMSNGATHWDGIDQAAMSPETPAFTKGYSNHAKNFGWNISDLHYKTWEKSIGSSKWAKHELAKWNTKFGTNGFVAPQISVGNGSKPYTFNKGKTRFKSAACHGSTIFWSVD
jgi:hypothetical protein